MFTKPLPKLTSCLMYLAPEPQLMPANVPLITVPWPILRLYRPKLLVVTAWLSWNNTGPDTDPSNTEILTCMEELASGLPERSRAAAWYLMALGAWAQADTETNRHRSADKK